MRAHYDFSNGKRNPYLPRLKSISAMPVPEPNGFVNTLNRMGYMTSVLDPYSQAFVDFSLHAPGPSVDIGAAYGVAALAALAKGARVIANDVDQRHLEILAARAPASARKRLEPREGSVLDPSLLPEESAGAVLCCRVLHFMKGADFRRALKNIHRWLAPKGKAFIVCETPYLKPYLQFVPVYERRKKRGAAWPGLITDPSLHNPGRRAGLPPIRNWVDPEILSRELGLAGFRVERSGFIPRPYFPEDLRADGRESAGAVGAKV